MEITLTNLSLNDTNLTFGYIYTDANAMGYSGSNTLKVYGCMYVCILYLKSVINIKLFTRAKVKT